MRLLVDDVLHTPSLSLTLLDYFFPELASKVLNSD